MKKIDTEKYKIMLAEMRNAVDNGTASRLSIKIAGELKGKRIRTIYLGYDYQDGIDEFIVGDIKHEIYSSGDIGQLCLYTKEGENTHIYAHKDNNGLFTCTDSDRFVYFIEVNNES